MQNYLRKIGFVVWVLALLFFFSTTLVSAHVHAKTQEKISHHCTFCQINHGGTKGINSPNHLQLLNFALISNIALTELAPLFSNLLQVPSIRGPPLAG